MKGQQVHQSLVSYLCYDTWSRSINVIRFRRHYRYSLGSASSPKDYVEIQKDRPLRL